MKQNMNSIKYTFSTLCLLSTFILAGCQSVTTGSGTNIGKSVQHAKNANQIVKTSELDQYGAANFHLAVQYYQNKQYDASFDKIQIVLQRYPRFAEGYNLLGVLEEDRGRIDEALRNFTKAFELDPNFPQAFSNYSRLMCQRSGVAGLEQSVLKLNHAERSGLYTAVAECALEKGDLTTTLAYVDKALTANPNYAQPFLVKAFAMGKMSRFTESITAIDRYHNLNGYTARSLQIGMEAARQANDQSAYARFNQAYQQYESY